MDKNNFIDNVYSFYSLMKSNEVNLIYEGEITHTITKAFASLTETTMDKENESSSTQRKVFHVMVECLQNISKHAVSTTIREDIEAKRGVLLIHKKEDYYGITTGNIILTKNVKKLKDSLDYINSLDKEGLKKLYKEQIRGGELSEKQGAGLGLIDIAKKTGNPLEYNFSEIDEQNTFFILTSKVTRKK